MASIVALAGAATAVAMGVAVTSSSGATRAPADAPTCAVTIPPQRTTSSFNYGNAGLRVAIYWPRGILPAGERPDGSLYARINPDGSISAKVGWWRGVAGKLTITGRRLDRRARPARAEVPEGYGPQGFQVSGITFPTIGCWRVVGRVGNARLMFVVKVTKLPRSS